MAAKEYVYDYQGLNFRMDEIQAAILRVNYSSGGICLVLASLPYDTNEYISDYEEFMTLRGLK